ncbi:Uncharacterised protein [Legionella lansingensis]|uniref:Uncharacterized protein n=1 Tax=Legionella lansingensis TaxID=45067 RepID=A0A0W0VRZ9_9GAMM|nr:DUF5630 domain-containing protein [Legionella lansingensis]KTD22878.1 hypothetical protein Llan_0995 [Legionella lansingensis]SNV53745.1 Uncharacterised protein [Legionella lansingensis]
MFRCSSGTFFEEKSNTFFVILKELQEAKPDDILTKIQNFVSLYEKGEFDNYFTDAKLQNIFSDLISLHSEMLTEIGFASGKQVPLTQLNPLQQLLGVYYLSLALKEIKSTNPDKCFNEKATKLLHKAADSSIQAILFLRPLYFLKCLEHNPSFAAEEVNQFASHLGEKYKSPGYLLYGELLMYLCQRLIKIKNLTPSSPINSEKIYRLFHDAVLNLYVGEFLQTISPNEINNAYGITTGDLPFARELFLYSNGATTITDFCREMRKGMNIGVDISGIKNEAKKIAEIIVARQCLELTCTSESYSL